MKRINLPKVARIISSKVDENSDIQAQAFLARQLSRMAIELSVKLLKVLNDTVERKEKLFQMPVMKKIVLKISLQRLRRELSTIVDVKR